MQYLQLSVGILLCLSLLLCLVFWLNIIALAINNISCKYIKSVYKIALVQLFFCPIKCGFSVFMFVYFVWFSVPSVLVLSSFSSSFSAFRYRLLSIAMKWLMRIRALVVSANMVLFCSLSKK